MANQPVVPPPPGLDARFTIPPVLEEPAEANYSHWAIQVGIYMRRDGVEMAVVDGGQPTPAQDRRCKDILIMSAPKHLIVTLNRLPTARAMWDYLRTLYVPATEASVVNLQREFFLLRQDEMETPNAFLKQATDLYHKLLNAGSTMPETAVCTQVLAGLSAEYLTTANIIIQSRVALTLTDLGIRLKDAHLLRQAQGAMEGLTVTQALFGANGRDRTGRYDKGKLKCSHCGKHRHDAEHCWELHPELRPKKNDEARPSKLFPLL